MKTITILLSACVVAFAFSLTSCKKEGCTDEVAINYFEKNKVDDGSCSFSTTKIQGRYSYTWNDTLVDTADVYSIEQSYMAVYSVDGFNFNENRFDFLVNWPLKTMAVPDSLLPDSSKAVVGTIVDKNTFNVTFTKKIKVYNAPGTFKDTNVIYNFVRL